MRVLCRFAETLFFPVCRMYDDYDDAGPIYVQLFEWRCMDVAIVISFCCFEVTAYWTLLISP